MALHARPVAGVRPPLSARWERWSETGAGPDANDQLRSRVLLILAVVTLVGFGAIAVLVS